MVYTGNGPASAFHDSQGPGPTLLLVTSSQLCFWWLSIMMINFVLRRQVLGSGEHSVCPSMFADDGAAWVGYIFAVVSFSEIVLNWHALPSADFTSKDQQGGLI